MKIKTATLKRIIKEEYNIVLLKETMNVLHEKQGNKLARAQKELELIKKDPKAYIQQRTAKLQKKAGKGKGGESGAGGVVDDLQTALDTQKKEAGENAQQMQQVDQLGDQAMAQAQKDPAQKDNMKKIQMADKAVGYIEDIIQRYYEKETKEIQALIGTNVKQARIKFAKLKEFNIWSDKFTAEAIEAFKKGKDDPSQYDEVITMAQKAGFKP